MMARQSDSNLPRPPRRRPPSNPAVGPLIVLFAGAALIAYTFKPFKADPYRRGI